MESPMERLLNLISTQNEMMDRQQKVMEKLVSHNWEQARMLEVLGRSVLKDTLADVDVHIQQRQWSMLETMELVSAGHSLARWGDGEIKLMLQPEFELMFQKPDPDLAQYLSDLLAKYDQVSDHLLLAFPTVYTSRLWMGIWAENWHLLKPLLEVSQSKFANTHVSRPLFFQKHRDDAVDAWRRVWDGKRVCVVAGRGSKFELIPELFDNVKSVTRVDSLPRDAFSEFDELSARLSQINDVDIFLIALGPTGTVLAGHLGSELGGRRHAIDIGHLASSYLNVFKGGADPERVPVVRK